MSTLKDQSILDLLEKLAFSSRGWITVDNWEADLCAIGIASKERPRHLVYVSTYDKAPYTYDYECEDPAGSALDDYRTVDKGKNVDFQTLKEIIEKHLT